MSAREVLAYDYVDSEYGVGDECRRMSGYGVLACHSVMFSSCKYRYFSGNPAPAVTSDDCGRVQQSMRLVDYQPASYRMISTVLPLSVRFCECDLHCVEVYAHNIIAAFCVADIERNDLIVTCIVLMSELYVVLVGVSEHTVLVGPIFF